MAASHDAEWQQATLSDAVVGDKTTGGMPPEASVADVSAWASCLHCRRLPPGGPTSQNDVCAWCLDAMRARDRT